MTVQNKTEDDEGRSNNKPVVQQRRKAFEVFYTSEQMKVAVDKGIQTEVFQQGNRLDEEIGELWHLMQRCKKNNNSKVQIVIWMTMEDCEDHYRVEEQQKLSVHICISKAYGDLQSKIWDPGGLRITVT